MKIHGEDAGNILLTEDVGEGQCMIKISIQALRSLCARAKMNRGRQTHLGPITVKYYVSKQVTTAVDAWQKAGPKGGAA